MAKVKEIEEKTFEILKPIVQKCGVEIYDVEYVKEGQDMYLRAYIDKEGGVTIDDCVDVNHLLSDALDEADYIADAYILEVSSPGLGRTLKKDIHLEKSIGQDVDIKLYKAVDNSKEYTGELLKFDANTVTIDSEGEKTFERSNIAKINLTLYL